MAVTHPEGGLSLECDECGEELDSVFDDEAFHSMISYARMRKWTIGQNEDGSWSHYCPEDKPGGLAAQKRLFGL